MQQSQILESTKQLLFLVSVINIFSKEIAFLKKQDLTVLNPYLHGRGIIPLCPLISRRSHSSKTGFNGVKSLHTG
jgi:hypothetical protein